MDKLIKKLETIVKYTKNTRINVDITDLQRLIQEIKNQDKIINEMAERIKEDIKFEYGITDRTVEQIRKNFEERSK